MKTIPSHPNYKIDENGNVYNIHTNTRIKHQLRGKYPRVALRKQGVKQPDQIDVRNQVAELFVPLPPHLIGIDKKHLRVRSKNGQQGDLRHDNITWCIQQRQKQPYHFTCGRFHLKSEECE